MNPNQNVKEQKNGKIGPSWTWSATYQCQFCPIPNIPIFVHQKKKKKFPNILMNHTITFIVRARRNLFCTVILSYKKHVKHISLYYVFFLIVLQKNFSNENNIILCRGNFLLTRGPQLTNQKLGF